jgi:serine/threonine protein phosphatase 1
VGDVHGRLDLLTELRQAIHEDAWRVQAPRNVVVYLGDYIDRGPDSRGVIELLASDPLPGFESVHLMGNHEHTMLGFLANPMLGAQWLSFGGDATLESYGVAPPETADDRSGLIRAQAALQIALPAAHRRFLAGLKYAHAEGGIMLVHAGIRPGLPLDRQRPEDLLWIREPFLHSAADHGKLIVHGHTITERPIVNPNRIGIDTGAVRSGRLTALVTRAGEHGFLQT